MPLAQNVRIDLLFCQLCLLELSLSPTEPDWSHPEAAGLSRSTVEGRLAEGSLHRMTPTARTLLYAGPSQTVLFHFQGF